MKRILLLGASGSIGTQTIDVVNHHKDEFCIIGCSVGFQIDKLREMLRQGHLEAAAVAREEDAQKLREEFPNITIYGGEHALRDICQTCDYDVLVNAVVGFRGLVPTLTAIERGIDVALANKESLVAGGPLVKRSLKQHKVQLYPIDSEHSAIFQCLQGNTHGEIDKLIVTASGGSFRDKKREELQDVTPAQALKHPNWAMGGRITIDSATMMNKGFEVIEAHYLFDIPFSRIDVLIQRESIIHSMVQYQDHAVMAQLGTADMRLPIQYALSYPRRLPMHNAQPLDFLNTPCLHFEKADMERYPLLALAYQVGEKGGNLGAVMNGADEMAVAMFLQEEISFLDIETSIIKAVEQTVFIEEPTLDDLIASDAWAREYVRSLWKGDRT